MTAMLSCRIAVVLSEEAAKTVYNTIHQGKVWCSWIRHMPTHPRIKSALCCGSCCIGCFKLRQHSARPTLNPTSSHICCVRADISCMAHASCRWMQRKGQGCSGKLQAHVGKLWQLNQVHNHHENSLFRVLWNSSAYRSC